LHDIAALDRRGIAGGLIATEVFADAARQQAELLGFDPAVVYVPHPVQNLDSNAVGDLADAAYDASVAMLKLTKV
jgi:hypothetical protein